jgi:hypothetical protein
MDRLDTDAWHVVTTTDPLLDSGDEHADEHVRADYGISASTSLPFLTLKTPS